VNAQLWRDNEEIILRPKTFEVLRYLAEHPAQLVTKAALLDAVWAELAVGDTMPAICVGELRKALGDKARTPHFIETIHRRGYRFIAKVTMAAAPATAIVPPALPRSPAPIMVGRETELGQMREWFVNMLGSVRQVICVAGEPGIGKSTFVRAFLDGVAREGKVRIGRGQCVEQHGRGEPYMPVLEALTRLCQAEGGDRLIEILERLAPTWLTQMPVLRTKRLASACSARLRP
jgi:DNA-binding winged helix-turn-helix (wHTH) protein